MPEFKLARLRYTWQNAWVTGTVYARDSIVQNSGKVYVCLTPHTAGIFAIDFASNYWSLLIDGKTWKGNWAPSTYYDLGNIVNFSGTIYYATTAGTSGTNFPADASKWTIYSQTGGWGKAWTTSTAYGLGQVVNYNGIVYKCNTTHVSASTLELNQSYWTVLDNGVYFTGAWSQSALNYKLNDIVKVGPELFICTTPHTPGSVFDITKFTLWMPGEDFATVGVYTSNFTYQIGDTVTYGGYEYTSIISNNAGNTPSTSAFAWVTDSVGYSAQGAWLPATTYKIGSVVTRNGNTYVALSDTNTDPSLGTIIATYNPSGSSGTTLNLIGSYLNYITSGMNLVGTGFTSGQTVVSSTASGSNYTAATVILSKAPDSTPSGSISFTGINSPYWSLLNSTIAWKSFWTLNSNYIINDVVIWQNGTYRCIQNHTATVSARPDNDTTNTYWVIYTLHARRNAGSSVGDITTYANGSNTNLNIGPTSTVLRATSNSPGWRYITSIPNVFYVSTNGTDLPTYGNTLDLPYKSIKYACQQLLAGVINTNASYLINANKEFVVQEMYQWMVYQKANSISPFSPSSVFDQTRTLRDARYIVDAVVYDITRGGNSQTVASTLAYFATSTSFINSTVASEMPYFIASLNYLLSLIGSVLSNTIPATNYQSQNGVASPVTQTINTAYVSESGAIVPANNATITVTNSGSVAWTVSGSSDLTLNLIRGNTYNFSVNSPGHNFYIQTTGAGYVAGNVWTAGVGNNGASTGTVTFTVPYNAPSVLYYQDSTTASMYGKIAIFDATANPVAIPSAQSSITSLFSILTTALTNVNTSTVPQANSGITATVFVKTGTYSESLPISVPENVAIVGDELRGVVVQPATSVTLTVTGTTASNGFQCNSTSRLTANMPVQFAGTSFGFAYTGTLTQNSTTITSMTSVSGLLPGQTITGTGIPNQTTIISVGVNSIVISQAATVSNTFVALVFGIITPGQTYYVVGTSITPTTFSVSLTPSGSILAVPQIITTSTMIMYGGQALSDMFYLRNGTGLRNMTLTGLLGTLTAQNTYYTQRPTGGAYAGLDPGAGPNDTSVWIFRRSPYVQNVTTFGSGCVGLKIDGTLHNGGNKSIVANDFTQVLSDGVGCWCTGPSALTELVSVFSYYNYTGYLAEAGGRIRATNGNSSYGTYGVIAEGYDVTETPATGIVFNRSQQVQASIQSSFGVNATLQKLGYSNAGSGYYIPSTNLLTYSNLLNNSAWITDGNVTLNQNITAPTGLTEAWTVLGSTSGTDSSYLYQNIAIQPAGSVYTNIAGSNISGSGASATFNITVTSSAYIVTVNTGGTGYVNTNQIRIFGGQVGGQTGVNDIIITVTGLSGSTITGITTSGTVPGSSAKPYVISIFAKSGTASTFDLHAIFSGSSTVRTGLTYTWATNTVTSAAGGNYAPTTVSQIAQTTAGWYRIYAVVYDSTGLNNQLQLRIYPRGQTGTTGTTLFYGAQVHTNSSTISFYSENLAKSYTNFANFEITGSGQGAVVSGDETRGQSVFQSYVTTNTGGSGYLTSSNQSQGSTSSYIILSAADTNTANNYIGQRVFISSGTGVGQYAQIVNYTPATKIANLIKESFNQLTITSTTNSTSAFNLAGGFDTTQLYLNQQVQFVPTQYLGTVTSTSFGSTSVVSSTGGITNILSIASTANLQVNLPLTFTGPALPAANLVAGYTYYVAAIINSTDFQIKTGLQSNAWQLSTSAGQSITLNYPTNTGYLVGTGATTNMVLNQPVTFSGVLIGGVSSATTYYINNIIDANTFTVSNSLITISATNTTVTTNVITITGAITTASLVVFNPIVFTGTTFGGIVAGTTYYVNRILSLSTFTVVSSLIQTTATATTTSSNLITVGSTSGFVANNPIVFTGTTFGGIVAEQVYYILAINNATSFTISTTQSGSAVNLSNGTGSVLVKTGGTDFVLTTASGTMTGTSTSAKRLVTNGSGSMTATVSTSVFGGVTANTIYYVYSIGVGTFQVTSASNGGSPVAVSTASGSMNIATVGWDHINPGTAIAFLDSTSTYYIEPRITYTEPGFTQTASTITSLAAGTSYVAMAAGNNYWIALPNNYATGSGSSDGINWTPITLPVTSVWTSIAYGNSYWVAVANSSNTAIFSSNNGAGWRTSTLPSSSTWNNIAYGAGSFVAITTGNNAAAYSTNYGYSWSSATLPTSTSWSSLAYGAGIFVAIASSGTTSAYSTNGGATWTSSTLPASTTWSSIAYGNGRFVAVSSTSNTTAYSFNGSTWYSSNLSIAATAITYGQGCFLTVSNSSGISYTSEDGINWKTQTVTNSGYGAVAFGYASTTYNGLFVTAAGQATSSYIATGVRTKGRVSVISGVITGVSNWEPGSGYTTAPTISIPDPNATSLASVVPRVGNGTLGNPTIINPGVGYSSNTTTITVTGNGYANAYQSGYTLIVNNLTSLPSPGANLTITGLSTIYKITSASIMFSTVTPNIEANLQINPNITSDISPADSTPISIRSRYSQVRLTNHDYLNIGYGNFANSNYPNTPLNGYVATTNNQFIENNYGRVFFTSTDQDGNFKVGALFGVQQSTGIVTLSVSQFGLAGLSTLSLGGIAVGGSSTTITQFSTDGTFAANSDNVVPTQKAIKTYVASRLTQGGSNSVTAQLLVGTMSFGAPNIITSQIPNGQTGSVIKVANKVNISGQLAGIDGTMTAMEYFYKSFWNHNDPQARF